MHRAQTTGAVLVAIATATAAAVAQGERVALPRSFGSGVRTVITPESVWRLIVDPSEQPWRPDVNREHSRGYAAALYPKVAPAVVVVRTDSGHGTGFLIDDRGTLVTNHHVVEEGLRHDAARRASYAMVHLGTLSRDGSMTLQPGALRAYVYAIDAARDLALLRVERAPGAAPLPFLALAEAGARPGVPIVVVGHPAAGMLWTVRTGEVASVGRMPADMVNTVMTRLSAADSRRDDIASALARLTSRRIILTSAGINPGDSGGPVLDAAGRVVAVTFAVPASPSLAKFSYHMHLDELKVFLQDVPSAPRLVPPDPWALGPQVALDDLDGDRRPDVLVAGDEEPDTFLFDLDNDTPLASVRDLDDLVSRRTWEFEAGLRSAGDRMTAFYDSNGDGTIDLVLTAGADPAHHARFTRDAAGRWQVQTGAPLKPIGGANLRSPALAARFDALVSALVQRARQAGG
jgi:S1-C subfamily serine protease